MNKKTLFGSIFVLSLILLMPSIPAVQQKIINDNLLNNYNKLANNFFINNINNFIDIINENIKNNPEKCFIIIYFLFLYLIPKILFEIVEFCRENSLGRLYFALLAISLIYVFLLSHIIEFLTETFPIIDKIFEINLMIINLIISIFNDNYSKSQKLPYLK